MNIPYRCPVCNGTGIVPAGIYTASLSTGAGGEACRSCRGSGIVWEHGLPLPPLNEEGIWCTVCGGSKIDPGFPCTCGSTEPKEQL